MRKDNVPTRPTPPKKAAAPSPKKPKVAPPDPTGPRPVPLSRDQMQLPEIYYVGSSTTYMVRVPNGEFVQMNESSVKIQLQLAGLSNERIDGQPSEVEEEIHNIRNHKHVDWMGPLAGHWSGFFEAHGNNVLVTKDPKVIEANADWSEDNSTIYDYFERLLGPEQSIHFHIWMKLAREALLNRICRQAPTILMVGKADQGKSLGGKLIKLMLGGRVADPSQYSQGETTFNADLFFAEFLFADDTGSGHEDRKSQLKTANTIKQLTAAKSPMCRGKYKTPIPLDPLWRIMYALNEEMEDLKTLPALSDGLMDKLLIFRTVGRAIDRPTSTNQQYQAYEELLTKAIPDYLGWLTDWQIPEEYLGGRWGQVTYHNPWVLRGMQTFTPQTTLLALIDDCGAEIWDKKMNAHDIEAIVKAYNEREAFNLLKGFGRCGMFLMRLCREQPTRVQEAGRLHGGPMRYLVLPPADSEEAASTPHDGE